MRGSRNPRKRSSSPSTVLKTNKRRMSPNQPHAPCRNAWPAWDPTKVPKSRLSACGSVGMSASTSKATLKGIRTSHTLPPMRPLRGLRGGAEPERLAERRTAKTPLLASDEDDDEHELPDQTGRQTRDQRLCPRHVALPRKPVCDSGRDEPRQRRHRQRRGRPDRNDRAPPVLRNLDRRHDGVGA